MKTTEEKKEVESSEEDEKELKEGEEKGEEKDSKTSEEEGTSEEKEEEKEDFEKSEEYVPVNKYNQSLRKLREAELEKRELEKKLQATPPAVTTAEEAQKAPVEKKEDEDKFFEDEEEKDEEKKTPNPSELIDEKLKPVLETLSKREKEDHKKDRTAFFEAHPEYREDSEKWSGLLDTMDRYINPNSDESHYEQLNAAHILYTGQNVEGIEIADKKREMAGDAATSGAGAQKAGAKEEFTSEDRKTMKEFEISEEGMRAYKKKVESGSMQILG